jgi:hydroxymethylpyrimidine kinase/phosphomethylpyrimidine kinase/thiamine-phosphate diphosphorylase
MTHRKRLLTIAASDSSGGAGLHADTRIAPLFDLDCAAVVSAITAQSSDGALAVQVVDQDILDAQWQGVLADGEPDAVRVGWLADLRQGLGWLNRRLESLTAPIVWDPVLAASRGGLEVAAADAHELRQWLARCQVITPNTRELQTLAAWLGLQGDEIQLAEGVLALGCQCVVVTGGDDQGPEVETRVYVRAEVQPPETAAVPHFTLQQPRIERAVHGSGCHFSALIAAALAAGERLYDALLLAAHHMSRVMAEASARASGYHQPFIHKRSDWHQQPADQWPQVRVGRQPGTSFARAQGLGLYALVDQLDWLQQLLALGVDTLQWRVKERSSHYRLDMQTAIDLCKAAGVLLYINDDWRMAIELGAYGVHLGQEDLATADLTAIANAGLRLGISTHTDWEVLRAWQLRPSYIAFGPVHPPLSKQLKYPPLGYQRLANWWQALRPHLPLTCIGGITEANIGAVVRHGIDSCAIVTALMPDEELATRHQQIKQALENH